MVGSIIQGRRGLMLPEEELLKTWQQMPQLVKSLEELGDRVKRLEGWLVGALFLILLNLMTSVGGIVLGFIIKKI